MMAVMRTCYLEKKHTIKGFTLTELAIVFGVMGLILGAVWVAGNNARDNRKVSLAVNEIITIVHNIREMYAERSSFSGLPVDSEVSGLLMNAGVFPAEMINTSTGSPVINPWGGGTLLWVNHGGINNSFWVSMYNLTRRGCTDIATALGTNGAVVGLLDVESWFSTTNGSGQSVPYSGGNIIAITPGQSIDPVAVAAACSGGPDGAVSAEFVFSFQ